MNSNLPKIICHMMVTIDGKITDGKINGKSKEGSTFSKYMKYYAAAEGSYHPKALMCGRVTMEEFAEGVGTEINLDANQTAELNQDFIISDKDNYFIGVDTKGLLRWKEDFVTLTSGNEQKKFFLIMIVGTNTPKEYLSYLRSKNISYVFGGEENINFSELFTKLKSKFNVDEIVLEGGGAINGSVIDEDLIDELSILFLPEVINNVHAPVAFYKDLNELKTHHFKIKSHELLEEDVIWVKYTKVNGAE